MKTYAGTPCILKKPLDLSELDLEVEAIQEVGIGGQFATRERTVKFCRTESFRSPLMYCLPFEKWESLGNRAPSEKASALVQERLDRYCQPPIEKTLLKDLSEYVQTRKEEIG